MSTRIIHAVQSEDFQNALKALYVRAVSDPDFRQLALEDARQAFAEIGLDVGEWQVRFVEAEEGVDDVLVLPPAIDVAADLTEEELEAVAGGVEQEGCCVSCKLLTLNCIITERAEGFEAE